MYTKNHAVFAALLACAGLAPMTIQGGRLRLELPATSAVILTLR